MPGSGQESERRSFKICIYPLFHLSGIGGSKPPQRAIMGTNEGIVETGIKSLYSDVITEVVWGIFIFAM